MSESRCVACGEQTVYEEELGSAVCTHCGTLANPAQSVLASHLERVDVSGHDYSHYPAAGISAGATLKGRNGWSLAGQDKEARNRRNKVSMHEYIRTLAGRLSSPGSAVRAQGLFDQAMQKTRFRWGRKAKLAAGASLAIALRESQKSDSLRDIAYLLDEPHLALTRTFTTIVEALRLKLASADPAQHLPNLESHLAKLLQQNSVGSSPQPDGTDITPLPAQLVTTLAPLREQLPAVRQTAQALSALVTRVPTLSALPSAPTACAVLILSLEGELAASLPNAGVLAEALGTRVGVSKGVVMARYKSLYEIVEECVKDVPWLEGHSLKGKGRSKVAKRVVVARGVKDVAHFQDEIWRKRVEALERPILELEADEGDDEDSETRSVVSASTSTSVSTSTSSTTSGSRNDPLLHPKRKRTRQSTHQRDMHQISAFLLNPLGSPPPVPQRAHTRTHTRQDLVQHLLSAESSTLSEAFVHPPTRLQLLSAARGGGGEDLIRDEELFEEGEMEEMIRDEAEVGAVRVAMGWDEGSSGEEDEDGNVADVPAHAHKRRRIDTIDSQAQQPGSSPHRTRRINMDALARLLDPDTHLDGELEDLDFDFAYPENNTAGIFAPFTLSSDGGAGPSQSTHPDETVEEWRPMSPGGHCNDGDERYDS